MPLPTKGEQIPLVVGKLHVPRILYDIDHPYCKPMHWFGESYQAKFERRAQLLAAIEIASVKQARRCAELWDVDRERDMRRIAKKLLKQPDLVVSELRATLHGCRYLISQWEYLKTIVDSSHFTSGFEQEEHILTLSLAGVPFHNRIARHSYEPIPGLDHAQCRAHVHAYLDMKIADLSKLVETHVPDDQAAQLLSSQAPDLFPDNMLAKLQRELAKVERDLAAMYRELEKQTVAVEKPAAAAAPKTETAPPRKPNVKTHSDNVPDDDQPTTIDAEDDLTPFHTPIDEDQVDWGASVAGSE